jgi:hypothetical protein
MDLSLGEGKGGIDNGRFICCKAQAGLSHVGRDDDWSWKNKQRSEVRMDLEVNVSVDLDIKL